VTVKGEAAERRQLTVMFTDLVGSTDLASALDPEDWHEVLDAYQHRVAAIVAAHGGVIAQFQGDGAVAYFGYPEAQESAGRDALSAGLAIVEDIVVLGSELPVRLGIGDLQARAGIHTGEVLVAPVTAGGNDRLPDVWGQVPNMAARLQAAGQPGQVLVTGDTAALVTGFFELESLGSLTLKGIAQPVAVFRVLLRGSARHRLEARPLTGFVPRAEATVWLADQWDAVRGGQGRLTLVSGEPGIGKSRLMLEFSADVAAHGYTVRTALCSRRGSLSPLQPFGELMGEVPATPDDVVAWVESIVRTGPFLLIIEDAHWADPSTLEAAQMVARGLAPVLILMSARPEIADDPHLRPDAHMQLDPLSPGQTRDLLDRLPDASQLDRDTREALVARADGVPLFVEELARGLAEGPGVTRHAMPTTLSEVITARLDRLGDAKRVAQAASVIGRTFDRTMLSAATGLNHERLDLDIDRLVEHAVIEPTTRADEMQFRHALFHEASYRSVLRPDRSRIHAAVGDLLVRSGQSKASPEIAAYHLGAAGRAADAVPLWKQASHTARMHARFREAAGHEREVLALVSQLPEEERETAELKSRSRLVLCLTAVDQSAPEALQESRRVEELARRLGEREILLRNYMVLVPWWQASAEYGTVNAILAEARREAEALGDQWTLQLVATYEAITKIWQGMLQEGLAQIAESYETGGLPLDASLRDLPPMRSVELMAVAAPRVASALGCWLGGWAADAWRVADDVLQCATERRVPQAEAVAAVTAAIMAQLDGEREVVEKLAAEALGVADEVSTRQWRQWARALQWWAGEGIEEPELPGPLLRPYFLMLLADDPRMAADRSLGLLGEALELCRSTGERFCEAEILRLTGDVLRTMGHEPEAEATYETAAHVARRQGARMLELRALTAWARLPASPDRVTSMLASCAEEVAQGGTCRSLAEAQEVLGTS
jgi:class 3 adenylate cyclase